MIKIMLRLVSKHDIKHIRLNIYYFFVIPAKAGIQYLQ